MNGFGDRPTPTRRSFRGSSGLALVADEWGEAGAPGVLLLHGGGQTRHAWGGTAAALARDGLRAVALDQRGHGESEWPADGAYEIEAYVEDLLTVLDSFESPPALVGASLGGMAAMIACGERGAPARALVLVDVVPRLQRSGVERIIDFMTRHKDGFDDLGAASDAVAGYLPHRRRPADLDGLEKNLRLGEDGRYRWHWDPRMLAGDRRLDRSIHADRLAAAARGVRAPTLLVRGRMSDVVTEEGAREFLSLVPHARVVDVGDAGHMVAGDRNDRFTEAVRSFLAGL